MTKPHHQGDLLMRYLLGVASATERTVVEEQCFADETGLDELLRAEDELIDDYVRGALSPSDRRLFESHFLCTEQRRQRLETVESLVKVLAEHAEKSVSSERLRSFPLYGRAASSQPATLHNQLTLDQTGFDKLLHWLDSDRQRAGEKYETIRSRLIKVFMLRGFDNPEELADDTITRVASRAAELIERYVGDPASYFYGVARLVMLEATKLSAYDRMLGAPMSIGSVSDQADSCLEKCLEQLSESNRDLILQYYAPERENQLDNRKQLAQRLGVSSNALRLRVHRIRHALESCVRSCLQGEND